MLYTQRRTIAFHETDLAGMAHFSNFFRWMEEAEHAYLRSLGLKPVEQSGDTLQGWPRARAKCEYHVPVRYADEVEVALSLREIKVRALRWQFRFTLVGREEPVLAASGELTTVYAARHASGGEIQSVALPEEVLEALTAKAEEVHL